jgi:SAM-dependent methyltransferase
MGVKLSREKPKNYLVRILYLVNKLLPLSPKAKFKFYLNLEWVFDRFSHEYSFKYFNRDIHPARTHSKEFLLRMIKPEHTVLDLGCNNGFMADYISKKAKVVVGVDYDEKLIASARSTYTNTNLSFECVEAHEYLSKVTKKFDVLVLSHILEHLDNPFGFLKRFKSFFDYIYIEVPDFDKSLLNLYRKQLGLSLIYTDSDHVSEFDRLEMADLLEKSGLVVQNSEYRYGLQKFWIKVEK